jgi:hypothetical protein
MKNQSIYFLAVSILAWAGLPVASISQQRAAPQPVGD